MYLPATAEQPVRRAPIAGTTHRLGAGLRALLVEDNPDVAEAVRVMLVEFGFVVRLAETGEEALKIAPLLNIHLLVSDILMPGSLNGLDLARRLRDWMPNLPIVLCTGYAERAAEAEPSGFVLLRKPFDAPRLAEALRTALRTPAPAVQAEVAPAAPELG
jgi:CheY-like chemotaxis protein